MKKVICINSDGFNYISTGTEYKVDKETRDYYYVFNDSGLRKKYGKSRFEELNVKPKVKAKPIPKPKAAVEIATCVFARAGELTYKKKYEFKVIVGNDKLIAITDDNGNKVNSLKKRFKFD